MIKGKDVKPNDSAGYMQLAGFTTARVNRQDDRASNSARPSNRTPGSYYMISKYYWDNAQRNVALREPEKMANVEKGLKPSNAAADQTDYLEPWSTKASSGDRGAPGEDPARQQALIKSHKLQSQAEEIKKRRPRSN